MSQHASYHGAACHCRCCNGHYREYRAWIKKISDERERNLELEILDRAIKEENEKHAVSMPLTPMRPQLPKSRLKRHYDEVPDEPADTTF